MKTEKRYKKLTHEDAFKLLQENNGMVRGVAYTDGQGKPWHNEGSDTPLVGFCKGKFLSEQGIRWDNCFKIEEVNVFEVGDLVQVKKTEQYVSHYVGAVAKIVNKYANGFYRLKFGNFYGAFCPDDLELAPEPDPFKVALERIAFNRSADDWYLASKKGLEDLFNAGRDYGRKQNND